MPHLQPWGNGANEERLKKVLLADKGKTIKAVMVVHNETTTGVTRHVARRQPLLAAGPEPGASSAWLAGFKGVTPVNAVAPLSRSDIGQVRKVMDEVDHPAMLFVDGVSSIGACDFRMDEWRVRAASSAATEPENEKRHDRS